MGTNAVAHMLSKVCFFQQGKLVFVCCCSTVLMLSPLPPLLTEPCSLRGGCLNVPSSTNAASAPSTTNSTERALQTAQQVLDFNAMAGVMSVGSGAVLSFINLQLHNVAYKTSYVYTPDATPYKTDGIGTGLWPSVQFAPNSTVRAYDLVCHAAVRFLAVVVGWGKARALAAESQPVLSMATWCACIYCPAPLPCCPLCVCSLWWSTAV